mmetsp:Transcript_5911/g.15576  ORF Transcript_5911/g.15576 Transcript_5911/m.15576 type:complete len:215 (-) Transcript_5911:1274-1918(-)
MKQTSPGASPWRPSTALGRSRRPKGRTCQIPGGGKGLKTRFTCSPPALHLGTESTRKVTTRVWEHCPLSCPASCDRRTDLQEASAGSEVATQMSSSLSLATMFIACSSCRRSLHAYGISICLRCSRVRQLWHHLGWPRRPHFSHTCTLNPSDDVMSRSLSNIDAPYPIKQSRSISPSLSPPSRERPSVGWRVRTCRGPRARACILSMTMCLSFW